MAKMAYSDGSQKLRESVLSTYQHLGSLDVGGNIAYILTNSLEYPTTDGGGLSTEHRGVFQDDEVMSLAQDLNLVCFASNQAFIIGSGGTIITGYSDDATLAGEGFLPNEYAQERLRRTANHIVVSLLGSDDPGNHAYAVSYVIRGDSGSHDITVSQMEIISLGIFTLTYREFTEG
jgi:hypothetical protein